MELQKFKKNYEKVREKYKLPQFSKLNEEFDIEKISEKKTELLVREIRRAMIEKITAFLRFLELIVNPTQAPIFMLSLIKNIDPQTKKSVENLYKELAKIEISSFILDFRYDEKKEAEFVKATDMKWNELHKDLDKIAEFMRKFKEEKSSRNSDYFG